MTARPALTPVQSRELAAAQRLLKDSNAGGAVGRIQPLLADGLIHADVYALFGSALRAAGLIDDARRSFNAAINLDPENSRFWGLLAELLEVAGETGAELVARRRVAALAPQDADAQLRLGETLIRAGDAAAAAAPVLASATALETDSVRAAHALAVALRMLDRPDEALAVLGRFVTRPDIQAATIALHGHILADLGRFEEAGDHYRSAITLDPLYLDAQETMARLLPQIGQGDLALEAYRTALALHPHHEQLWASALGTARSLARHAELLGWAEQATRRFPDRRDFAVAHADALGACGAVDRALAVLEPLAMGNDAEPLACVQAAHWQLVAGDPQAAERHAQRAVTLMPDSQAGWAYLGTCWRLLDDPRERWLNDFDQVTATIMLDPPPGYADMASYLAELRDALTAMHTTSDHPADQSLRQGTQTRGHLFLRHNQLIESLGLAIYRQVADWLASLPTDAQHPFLRRNTRRVAFRNSWSVRLRDTGFHVSHIHQDGWLSSAFYVSLPPEVRTAPSAAWQSPGALTLGAPDSSLGLDLAPQRMIAPVEGMLVLFPSYVWHGTVPFASAQPRLAVAFDAVPG